MSYTIELPLTEGHLTQYTLCEAQSLPASSAPFSSRVAFAAVHVVADPNLDHTDKSKPVQLDWDATLAYRRHLWALGFAVAEAMDTAQRGMGLDWTISQELIRRSIAEARAVGGMVACGAGT